MINFGNNFGQKHNCKLCNEYLDSQEHLIECSQIKKDVKEIRENRTVQHDDIFSPKIKKKILAVKLFTKALRKRKEILDKKVI